jgi:XTP/dITP diphosphohydrolase
MITEKRRVILASNNLHKIEEIKRILRAFPFEVISLKEANIDIEVLEDGKTFEENAYKKAKEIMELTNEICLADDSGLEVYALDNAPGVYSARFSGEPCNDMRNNEKLLAMLSEVSEKERRARFVSSLVMLFPDGKDIRVEGYVEGTIGHVGVGSNGFGYDPLFIIPHLGKTFAELTSDEKNEISHRGNALKLLREKLEGLGFNVE